MRIGPRVMRYPYFLAPLAGYTQLAFRRAIRELGGVGLATTDLVQAGMLLSGRRKSLDIVATHPDDRPLSVQIFGGRRDELARAAHWLQDHGYEGIDINMGCPMAKVNGHGGGARLMCDTDGACATVRAVLDAVTVPVTVKMRLGWDRTQLTAPLLAREFERLGVAAVTIHGRTRQQGFHGRVDLEGIRAVVESVERIPVVGNGDVRTVADALEMRRSTGCAAVAIGRGAMLDPWIFRKLADVESGHPLREPTADEQLDFLVRHFTLMAAQHADYACTLFRKFAAWYGAKLGIPEELEDRLRRFTTVDGFHDVVREIRLRHGERRSRVATALVKVPNGPNELW
jgi:nifR3 family TIM-barrel protein